MTINIYSIFPSIDGEVSGYHQGRMSIFIRFAGCNVRCRYCDTGYALEMKSATCEMTPKQIVEKVSSYGINKVTITGGEPLLQAAGLNALTKLLYRKGFDISVETNGTLPIDLSYGVGSWVVDYKLPSSGVHKFHEDTFLKLDQMDFVKFVIMDRTDYLEALNFKDHLQEWGKSRCHFAFAPVHDKISADTLIAWLLEDRVSDAIINVQLHKVLNLKEMP